MNINIMIPDESVRQMLATGKRVQGTISLANAKEGNFNPHHRHQTDDAPDRLECPLRCGRAIVTDNRFRLYLSVKRHHVEFPLATLQDDLKEANDFFDTYEE